MQESIQNNLTEDKTGQNPEKIEIENTPLSGDSSPDATFPDKDLQGIFEAVLFLSNDPVPLSFFAGTFAIGTKRARVTLEILKEEYAKKDGGVLLVEVANGYQFVTNKKFASEIIRASGLKKRPALTRGMLDTLAIIAYKQPITLVEIEELRGVYSRMMLVNLMKKNLIKPIGRKEAPGRPLQYGTTDEFLKCFGLNNLTDLPKLSEIKEFAFDDKDSAIDPGA